MLDGAQNRCKVWRLLHTTRWDDEKDWKEMARRGINSEITMDCMVSCALVQQNVLRYTWMRKLGVTTCGI